MSFRSYWNDFKQSRPGSRFEDFHKKRQEDRSDGHEWRRALCVGMGILLVLGGIILLGMPGPGLLVVALGLALVASESLWMARGLDKLEVWLRKTARRLRRWWRHLQPYQRGLSIAAAAVLLLGSAGCLYAVVF